MAGRVGGDTRQPAEGCYSRAAGRAPDYRATRGECVLWRPMRKALEKQKAARGRWTKRR